MFPLRDDIKSEAFPIVNYTMIGLCVIVFVLQQQAPNGLVDRFGMIPARVSAGDKEIVVQREVILETPFGLQKKVVTQTLPPSDIPPIFTILSCTFLHGSLMHLLGNIWFLYVFGDNVEDRMGRLGYFCFYLCSGIAASLTHFIFETQSVIPTIGASGAVAGVMGAYMWLHPHAKVTTIIPILFILQMIVVPAPVFLGIWFGIQLLQGTFSMGGTEAAGVAWWAHAGGFAFGLLIALVLGRGQLRQTPHVRVIVRDRSDW